MAEGSNDFQVELDVTANVAPFREQLRRAIEEAQKAGATIPLGGGAASATTAAGTLPTGSASSAAGGILTTPPTPIAATVSNPAVQMAAQSGGFAPTIQPVGGGAAPFFGAGGVVGPGGQIVPAGYAPGGMPGIPGLPLVPPPGPPVPVPIPPIPPQPRRPGQPGMRFGYGPYLSAAYGLHVLGGLAQAEMEHNRSIREAEGGPEGLIRADVEYQNRVARAFSVPGEIGLFLRESVTGDQEAIGQTLRAARRQDELTDARRERMFTRRGYAAGFAGVEYDVEQTRIAYERTMTDMRRKQTDIVAQVSGMYEGQPGLSQLRAQATDIGKEMELAGERQKREEAIIRASSGIEGMRVRAAGAGFRDVAAGLSPSIAARNAMTREHAISVADAALKNPQLLPDLLDANRQELRAFDVTEASRQRVRDIQTGGDVTASGLRAAYRPYEAGRQEILARHNAAMEAARGDVREQLRIARRSSAEAQEYNADEARRRGIEAIETTGATEAMRLGNARQPMLAGLRELNAERDAALAKAQRDNPAQLDRLRSYYAERSIDYVRRFRDRDTLTGMGLDTQERVTGILANNRLPWGERQAMAEAAGIAGNARERAEAFTQQGQPGFASQALQIGRNQLRAASEQFRRSLRVEEIEGINRVDLSSGSNIQRQLAAYRSAERDLGGGGDGTGGGGGGGGDDVKSWRDRVATAVEAVAEWARNGGGGAVGP